MRHTKRLYEHLLPRHRQLVVDISASLHPATLQLLHAQQLLRVFHVFTSFVDAAAVGTRTSPPSSPTSASRSHAAVSAASASVLVTRGQVGIPTSGVLAAMARLGYPRTR